jgi:hypothetical protein
MSLPPDIVKRYESLRECVLQAGRGGDQGWTLLMRCGLLAWARAAQELAPKQRVAPLNPPVTVTPDHLSAPLVQVLAGMILHVQQEVAHGF